MPPLKLVVPSEIYLPSYIDALRRGASPSNSRPIDSAKEEMAEIETDPTGFLAIRADDRGCKGPPVKMPDGSTVPRISSFVRWLWDGEFCGTISLRWQPGTAALPYYILGHTGYGVVPWKQRQGYATKALGLMLPEARKEGLPYIEITTDTSNLASQKVILANGGELVEQFIKPPQYGVGLVSLRYRIKL